MLWNFQIQYSYLLIILYFSELFFLYLELYMQDKLTKIFFLLAHYWMFALYRIAVYSGFGLDRLHCTFINDL